MKYDSIIIGGGLAGLTCAIRCAEAGLRTVLISSGENSLTFASGSIDVLGMREDNSLIQHPFEEFNQLPEGHPYRKLGAGQVKESLSFFTEQLSDADIELVHQNQQNHFRLTALGALRPTWLSQTSSRALPITAPAAGLRRVAIINIASFRDFQPSLVMAGMRKHPAFTGIEFITGDITPETLNIETRNAYELRSVELARALKHSLLSSDQGLNMLASALKNAAGEADLVVIPAVLGAENGHHLIHELSQMTGLRIHEVASLPPSLPGMRLSAALKQRFNRLGGMLIQGGKVTEGRFSHGRMNAVVSQSNPNMPLFADHFVLATGSFLSQGLSSDKQEMKEPTFDLNVTACGERQSWSSKQFINGQHHDFTRFGVLTDDHLRPYRDNNVIENLYCAGSIMSGFNPVTEGSAGGVAISTGWYVAEQIIAAKARS